MHHSLSSPAQVAFALIGLSGSLFAGTIHVDAGLTTGAGDGSSWANAFQGPDALQAALAVAVSGDDIFVAQGTYRASSTGTRTESFSLKNGVTLWGGFLGGESSPNERPVIGTYHSVLSGDLSGDDASGGLNDNTFHLIRTVGTDATAVIDRFTVLAGNANGTGSNNDRGGGILCLGNVSPTVRGCTFQDNRSSFGGAAGYCNSGAAPTFTDCSFIGGQGGSFGGAFDIASGGAVRFDRCGFFGNTAARAGALEIFATNGVVVTNCAFAGNTATGSGGGGAIWVGSGGDTKFRNCTIYANSSTTNAVAGLRNQSATQTTVVNCILWDNQGPGGAQAAANQANAANQISYSIVEGGFAGVGNLDQDPLLSAPSLLIFVPEPGSPCIDAGNNNEVPVGIALEYWGAPRFLDDPATVDTGLGSAPVVDIGANEWGSWTESVAGCFGNSLGLGSQYPPAQVGEPFVLSATTAVLGPGLALYFAGADGTNASGCGLLLPGLGEVLLDPFTPKAFLGTAVFDPSSALFQLAIPNQLALVGKVAAFQAAGVSLSLPGAPIELSSMLRVTFFP